MRHDGEVCIGLSRAELTAVREAVELTPNFNGRLEVRETIRAAVRARSHNVSLEREVAERFARRLVAVDLPTALVRAKLFRAIQDADRAVPAPAAAVDHSVRAA